MVPFFAFGFHILEVPPFVFVGGGVFKHDCTGKMFGTGQNRSVKWGVRLARVFVRRGSTVFGNLWGPRIFLYHAPHI